MKTEYENGEQEWIFCCSWGDKPQVFVLTGTQTEKGVALLWLTHETKRKQVTKGKGKWRKRGQRLWLEAYYLLVQNELIKCWSYLYSLYISFNLEALYLLYSVEFTINLWITLDSLFILICIYIFMYFHVFGFFFLSLSAAEVLKRFPAAQH